MSKNKGFTLIELMIVVAILAVIAAIAIPSYQHYLRKNKLAIAQQYSQCVSMELEKWKSRNFSYRGYELSNANDAGCKVPDGQDYEFSLTDQAGHALNSDDTDGFTWMLKGANKDARNYGTLMTSSGRQCKNRTHANLGWSGCGTGEENW